jgi:hypothetical protein
MDDSTMRTEDFLIGHAVRCGTCGKWYVPADLKFLEELGIPSLLANNWCSRRCYDGMIERGG